MDNLTTSFVDFLLFFFKMFLVIFNLVLLDKIFQIYMYSLCFNLVLIN